MSDTSGEQLVADLAWAVGSPAFVVGAAVEPDWSLETELIDRDHLNTWFGEPPRRVGHYFERLVEYALRYVRKVDVVGVGIQLHDASRRTVGELDFVYKDERGATCHLETAVKFYLFDPDRAGSQFPGPNASDNFESKMALLFDHQLCRADGLPTGLVFDRRSAMVRGCCFHHPTHGAPDRLPPPMAAGGLRGTWLRSDDVDVLEQHWGSDSSAFALMGKPHWLAPPVGRCERGGSGTPMEVLSRHEFVGYLRDHFGRSRSAVMASVTDLDSGTTERLCVVDASW